MCYDQEKTQAVDPRHNRDFERAEKQLRDEARQANLRCNSAMSTGIAGRALSDAEILAELFKYHPPNGDTLPKYAAINQAAKNFAEIVLQNCPPSADRSAAIRLIRDARMTANASIALNGLSL